MADHNMALARALAEAAPAEAERIVAENERMQAQKAELLAALEAVRFYCIPGMNWTDEIGQELLAKADAAIEKAKAT